MKIDTCWVNGNIQTVNDEFQVYEAMGCFKDKIVLLGTTNQLLEVVDKNTKIYDLKGNFVYPGFIDSHVHFFSYGQTLTTLPIRDKSKKEILELVKDAVSSAPKGEWIIGGMGWNNEVWDDPSYPTKEELDRVSPNNPVLLPRMDGHMIWVNSKAFEIANVTHNTANPSGGEFLRYADSNKLLGCASNEASTYIKSFLPKTTDEERKNIMLLAQEKMFSLGVTSCFELHATLEDLIAFEELYSENKLKIRISSAISSKLLEESNEYRKYFKSCPIIGRFDGRFDVRSVKFLADGSVGAQSAAQYDDYDDRPGHKGSLFYTDEALEKLSLKYAKHGMQLITHAIGDKTIDQVIKVYSKIIDKLELQDHRFRIEHFQLVNGDSLERTKAKDILVSMQPTHAPNSASMAIRRLGGKRAKHAYAVGEVLRTMDKLALGSDAPVAAPDPLDGIHSAITRKNQYMKPENGFYIENAISVEDALKGYTSWGAYAQFNEKNRGTIEVNKFADFVVLDKNILKTKDDDILNIKVLATVVANEIVYHNDKFGLIEEGL